MLYFDMVTRIDCLAEELQDLTKAFKSSDLREEFDPLVDELSNVVTHLGEIYNEFCRIELES